MTFIAVCTSMRHLPRNAVPDVAEKVSCPGSPIQDQQSQLLQTFPNAKRLPFNWNDKKMYIRSVHEGVHEKAWLQLLLSSVGKVRSHFCKCRRAEAEHGSIFSTEKNKF